MCWPSSSQPQIFRLLGRLEVVGQLPLQVSPLLGVLPCLEGGFWAPCSRGSDDQLGPGTPLCLPTCVPPLHPSHGGALRSWSSSLSGILALLPFCQSFYLSLSSSQHLYLSFCHSLLRPSPCLASVFLYSFLCLDLPPPPLSVILVHLAGKPALFGVMRLRKDTPGRGILQALPDTRDQFPSLSQIPGSERASRAGTAQPGKAESWA